MERLRLGLLGLLVLCVNLIIAQDVRSYDGSSNNLANPEWGAVDGDILWFTSPNFLDGSTPNIEGLPNPRIVSNKIFDQTEDFFDSYGLSDFVWVFGQFIDHDVTLVGGNQEEPAFIMVPEDDEHFVPGSVIFTSRSKFEPGTGTNIDNPRQFLNEVTSYIDASMVYGSDEARADWLRTFQNGKLKVSENNLLPWNTENGEFSGDQDNWVPHMEDNPGNISGISKLFVAGDVRANENHLLLTLHTLFVREHNSLCDFYKNQNPNWTDEQLYQKSRRMVGAYIQSITYNEWLPSMGINIPAYSGYRSDVNPDVFNVFSAAAFRMGHTLIGSTIVRMDNDGLEINRGNSSILQSFFNPIELYLVPGNIDPYLKGMSTQVQQEMDSKVIDDLRNSLFEIPGVGASGSDLAAINIERGRDRGLPSYNQTRLDFGLPRLNDFDDLTSNSELADLLAELYENIDNIDAWVGMLSEDHMQESMFGELTNRIIQTQFQNLRDGDRFYFETDNGLSAQEKALIRSTSFHDIIMRNTELEVMQDEVFFAMPHQELVEEVEIVEAHLELLLYPNPASNQATLTIFSEIEAEASIHVYSILGQQKHTRTLPLSVGINNVNLDLGADWIRGTYTILVESQNKTNITKLIKE